MTEDKNFVGEPGTDEHKCTYVIEHVGQAFCCNCAQFGPKRDTVEEMQADADAHMDIDCVHMMWDEPDGPGFLPGMEPQKFGPFIEVDPSTRAKLRKTIDS